MFGNLIGRITCPNSPGWGVCAVMKRNSLLVTRTYKSHTIMLPIKFRWDLTAEGASSKFEVISN
jgi:hypothetical protein